MFLCKSKISQKKSHQSQSATPQIICITSEHRTRDTSNIYTHDSPSTLQTRPKIMAATTEHRWVAFIPVKRHVRRMADPAHL
jgi:hypothetical protein